MPFVWDACAMFDFLKGLHWLACESNDLPKIGGVKRQRDEWHAIDLTRTIQRRAKEVKKLKERKRRAIEVTRTIQRCANEENWTNITCNRGDKKWTCIRGYSTGTCNRGNTLDRDTLNKGDENEKRCKIEVTRSGRALEGMAQSRPIEVTCTIETR